MTSGKGNGICFQELVLREELMRNAVQVGGFGGVEGWVVG